MIFNKKALSVIAALVVAGAGWTFNTYHQQYNEVHELASGQGQPQLGQGQPQLGQGQPQLGAYNSYGGSVPVNTHLDQIVLKNTGYFAAYAPSKRGPIWVGYGLDWNGAKYDGLKRPTSGFQPDKRVPDPVVTGDYTRQGYDRGHLAPSFAIGKFHGREAQIETFLLTNITPQIHEMNDGVWNSIERMESDDFAKRFGAVYIVCGPIFKQDPNAFPSGVAIPLGFFKAIRRPDNQTIAFIIPQEATNQRPEQFLTSIQEIEKHTGLNIFPDLPAEEKARQRTKIW